MRTALPTLCLLAAPLLGQDDPRDVRAGWVLPDEGYCDQPLVARLADGTWLTVLTTGAGHEGQRGQHVVCARSSDQGRTWSAPLDIEPASGPEASWAQPIVTPSGRVFVFYIFNDSGIEDRRADLLGSFAMRWSDDGGLSWSERATIPVRETAIDRENDFGGDVRMQWGVSRPLAHGGAVLVPFTKIGEYLVERTEGWFLRSPDLLDVEDPRAAAWELLPDGERGLRAAGPIASEPCLAELPDGGLACIFRTVDGHALLATSADGGRTWTDPAPPRDRQGRALRHPRACPRLWRLDGSRYLLWTHENATPNWTPGTRNPAWVRGGTVVDGALVFGPPEVLVYDPDPHVRISYPDLVVEPDGRAFVLETQKSVARTHPVSPRLLAALFDTTARSRARTPGLAGAGSGGATLSSAGALDGGWSFEADLPDGAALPAPLLSARAGDAEVRVTARKDGALELVLRSGERSEVHASEPGAVRAGVAQHVAVVLDLGPGIVRWFVDGASLDGGPAAPRGWGRVVVSERGGDEKLLLTDDARRDVPLPSGDRFTLGDPDGPNALLVRSGEEATLAHPFGRVARLGFVFTGVGFQPHADVAFPAEGAVRLRYASGFEQEWVWDLRDSNGAGRGDTARPASRNWTLVRTGDGTRWDGRTMYWQDLQADVGQELVEVVFDARAVVDAAGDDAEFAVLALAVTRAEAASGAPLSPLTVAAESWNADVLARTPTDVAGRGFRAGATPVARAALRAVEEGKPALSLRATAGSHFGRALLASEVAAIAR